MIDKRQFKDRVYTEISQLTKALSSPHRMEIIDLLANGEKTVDQIAREVHVSVANASQHLQNLRGSRMVRSRREKNFVYYSLIDDEFFRAWQGLRDYVLSHNQEVVKLIDSFREERNSLTTITFDELENRGYRDLVLLDVRPQEEFEKGHLPQAISVSMDKLDRAMTKIERTKDIIVYCRGPLCVHADDAVMEIRKKGYSAFRLEGGYPDWMTLKASSN